MDNCQQWQTSQAGHTAWRTKGEAQLVCARAEADQCKSNGVVAGVPRRENTSADTTGV